VNQRTERAQARAVIDDALSGRLSIDNFHQAWPDSDDPLIASIFDETEDTVEHVPGYWLRRGTNLERFRESIPYKILIVDRQLLLGDFGDVASQRLLEIRSRLLREVDLGQEDEALMTTVREFVARDLPERSI
jgi:hypothetical protein